MMGLIYMGIVLLLIIIILYYLILTHMFMHMINRWDITHNVFILSVIYIMLCNGVLYFVMKIVK